MAQATITTVEEGRIILTEIGGKHPVCLEIHRVSSSGQYEVCHLLLSYDEFKRFHDDVDTFSRLPTP